MAAAGKCCSRRLLGQQVAEALRRQGRRRREDPRVDRGVINFPNLCCSRPPRHRRDAHRSTPCGCACKDVCDPSTEILADYEVWKREEGYWYGEYTFLGAEGDPYVSSSWNYPYDHYYGFIHIELDGNALKQRNVFIYPPQTAEKCDADDTTEGEGICGVNGNEKVFGADQSASDCGPRRA